MKKLDILTRLKKAGVIAVVRGETKEEALSACQSNSQRRAKRA